MSFAKPSNLGCISRLALVAAAAGLLAACQESGDRVQNYRAWQPIPAETIALMQAKDTDAHQPILIRAFKKEAELEIWKLDHTGEYVHLKTFPMCRWSGQLGPKTREGDRQVPEGFYTITPGQMNPNSAYYLSFNVGYPNAYDKAHGFTGGLIMVHGDCSSAGCFSMTDQEIAEIYAIAREAFGGGQREIQMQSLPFRMTAENLAKHRFDPNIRFWKTIKEGSDQFEVSHRETKVAVCAGKYVFGATPAAPGHLDASAACPPMQEDTALKAEVAEKQRHDDAEVAQLVSKGLPAVKVVYADGGQHPDFMARAVATSRPDAIARGPIEVPIDEKGRPVTETNQVAVAAVKPQSAPAAAVAKPAVAASGTSVVARQAEPQAAAPTTATVAATATASPAEETSFFTRWLPFKAGAAPAAPEPVAAPVTPAPANVPLPPRRQAASTGQGRPQASLAIPEGMRAYAPLDR